MMVGMLMAGAALAAPGHGQNRDYPGNPGNQDQPHKVFVCHATSAVDNNPYVILHVSEHAADAHLRHEHKTDKGNGNGNGRAPRDLTGDLGDTVVCELPGDVNPLPPIDPI